MTTLEWVSLGALLMTIVFSVTLFVFILIKVRKEGFTKKSVAAFILALGALIIVYWVSYRNAISPAENLQTMLTLGLLAVTGIYALSAVQQANASMKMAEEMREQRVMASRPVIIQKAIVETETNLATFSSKDWFSYFEIYNTGNGSAIEVEISLLNKEKTPIHSQRKTFLRADDPPTVFSPSELASLEKSTFYLVCEYQSIFSRGPQPTWYQTWLPFETIEASEKGRIYVKPGELEFKEVADKGRIGAFGTKSKPK
jgi:Ca2+/Na+ antiporter